MTLLILPATDTLLERRRLSLPCMQFSSLASREQQPSLHKGEDVAGEAAHKEVHEPRVDVGLAAECAVHGAAQ